MGIDEHAGLMRANQANWDARTPVHLASRCYGLDQDLGGLAGRDVLHLQCHLGTETIAFAEEAGAEITYVPANA